MRFIKHDVKDLAGLPELGRGSFDVILCSNAFVLFEDARAVLTSWREYLRPGGFLVIDIPHEQNMRSGLFLEKAAKLTGVAHFPSNRVWIRSKDSFREVLESEGYAVENITELEKVTHQRSTFYTIDQADEQFDYILGTGLTLPMATAEFKQQARGAFRDEFRKAAVNGKVEIVDSLYVYVARKL